MVDSKNPHGVSDKVDPFWHAHVLHTRDYADLCDVVVDGFLHHEPLDKENSEQFGEVKNAYGYTRSVYSRFFGEPDPAWWPDPATHPEAVICVHYGGSGKSLKDRALFPDIAPRLMPRRALPAIREASAWRASSQSPC